MLGVFFYQHAIPMVATSNFLYFISFKYLFSFVDEKYKEKYPLLDVRNQPFDRDINKNLELWFRKSYSTNHEMNMDHWREHVIWYS